MHDEIHFRVGDRVQLSEDVVCHVTFIAEQHLELVDPVSCQHFRVTYDELAVIEHAEQADGTAIPVSE